MKPHVLFALLLPLAVAGCDPPFRNFPKMTDEGCKRVSENDPEVRREVARFASGTLRDTSTVDEARAAAYEACLRKRDGDARKGGVEPVKRGY